MDNKAAVNTSKLLLDLGVSVPIRTPRFLKKKGKSRQITLYTPTYGGMMRIANKYLSMGVVYEQIKDYTLEENLKFYCKHGKAMSEMVAYAVCRGYLKGMLFNKLIAWWLRWFVHPAFLQEAWFQMITLIDTKSFHFIIRSAQMINLTSPKLSHRGKGS